MTPSPAEPATERIRRKVFLSLLVALAVAVNAVENGLPTPLPWVRLGLANAVTLLVLVLHGFRTAVAVTLARVVLASLVAGGLLGPAFVLSLGGSLASVAVAGLLARTRLFSAIGLSLAGSFTHTLAQFALFPFLVAGGFSILGAAPPFLLLSLPAGAVTGWLVLVTGRALAGMAAGSPTGLRAVAPGSGADSANTAGPAGVASGASPPPHPLILASASPRRAQLLTALGIPFEVSVPAVDETPWPGEIPLDHVARLAAAKADAATARFPGRAVLAADTSVVLDGRIFGKPADREEARRMLALLQGRTHEVLTGYVVADGRGELRRGVERSLVTMRPLTGPQIEAYLEVGEYGDKAGAYAAQGKGSGLVERIEGSFTNVVGLPLEPVGAILTELGYAPVEPAPDGEAGDGRPGPVLY